MPIIFLLLFCLHNPTLSTDESPSITTKEFEEKNFIMDEIEWIGSSTYRYKEPWDVNGDGKVNLDDLIILIEHWLETPSQPDWCKDADVNRDGIVNVYDVLLIMIHWTG